MNPSPPNLTVRLQHSDSLTQKSAEKRGAHVSSRAQGPRVYYPYCRALGRLMETLP